MTDAEMRKWIDGATYEQLLRKWRSATVGDPFFRLEMGKYYQKVMTEKRKQVGNAEHVRASKAIGWDH